MEDEEELYGIAYSLYQKKNYFDATIFFRNLLKHSPKETKYWMGLGACSQMLKDYDEALDCYSISEELGLKQSPLLYIQAADCFFALNQIDKGLKSLERALQLSGNNKKISEHIAFMRKVWRERK